MSDNPIKVLVISRKIPPVYSGAGLRALRTYTRLQKNFNILPLIITDSNGGCYDNNNNGELNIHRIQSKKGITRNIFLLLRLFKKNEFRSYRIVHCFGTGPLNIAAGICARIFSKKLIIERTVNENHLSAGLLISIRRLIFYLRRTLFQNLLQRRADLLIALNKINRDEYIRIGVPEDKIWLRPNPIDIKYFYYPSIEQRKKSRSLLNYKENHFVHLMVGNICSRKNQLFALKYVKKLPENHRLLIVGPTLDRDESYLNQVEAFIIKNGLSNRVKLLIGYYKEVLSFYHASDIFTLPSLNEGLPNALLEALCCGLPALINEELGLDYIVCTGKNGMNLPLKIDLFVKSAQLSERLYKFNHSRVSIAERAHKMFSSDRIDKGLAERLVKLYYQ